MNKFLFGLILLLSILFSSCETDIDVNADFKDIPVVYGLINPQDSVHYIKITRIFSNEGNALELANNAANYDYDAGELDVTLDEWNNANLVKSYALIRTVNEVIKSPGIFDNSSNVLYRFEEKSINRNSTYKLKIINKNLDKETTVETRIVQNSVVGVLRNKKFLFWNGSVEKGSPVLEVIRIKTGAYIGRIEALFVFNYFDYFTTASGKGPIARRVVMPLGINNTTTIQGEEALEWQLTGTTFFNNIASAVPSQSSIGDFSHRLIDNVSIEFNVDGEELATYISVVAPSTSINQNQKNYTNVSNGLGVLSSEEVLKWESSFNPVASNQVNLTNPTIKYLATHSSLVDRGFCFGSSSIGFSTAPCVQQ